MADKWEELFRTLAENTHSITQILDETNEGDELDEKYKVHPSPLGSSQDV